MNSSAQNWQGWGRRLKDHLKARGSNLAKLAERIGKAESTLRSWTNGTREINLDDFFLLCEAANADPCLILYGRPVISDEQRKRLNAAMQEILGAEPARETDLGLSIRPATPQKIHRKQRI